MRAFILLWAATGVAAAASSETLAHAPGPRPSAEQVLINAIPGRPPVPTVREIHEREGFARDRLYSVPPPGEHPRIVFARSDLPRIRRQLTESATGRRLAADLARRADPGDSQGWVARAYAALAAGDEAAFDLLWRDPANPHQNGPPGSSSSPLRSLLFFRALSALLDNDTARGQETAAAITTYSRWLRTQVEAAATAPGAENYWLALRPVVGDFGGLGFLYDFAHPFMSTEQAAEVRGLIGRILTDRYGLGMDLPPHWRNWNFIGMGLYFPLMAFAIEGEDGFDPRLTARGRELARDYILHSCSALGGGKEGVGYHTAGLAHLNLFALALANRGDVLLTLDRYQRMLDTWFLWTLQPYGREWASEGDLGTFPPTAAVLQSARVFFPQDPIIALVAGQAPEVTKLDRVVPEIGLLQLLTPVDLGGDAAAGRPPAFPSGLPRTLYDPERGVLFARSAWTPDALAVQWHARSDTTYPSHDHADRGAFILSALGRSWTVPAFRETESKYHSLVTIDGKGQGYFPTPARWLRVAEGPLGVAGTVDLSYCYDWRWMKSSFLASDDQLTREPWLETFREARDRLLARIPRDRWERDPSPAVKDYYAAWEAGDPRMWGAEDAWVLRTPYNPVRKAFRSLGLAFAETPFVVIADDIRKDNAEHLYVWQMILPMDVEAYEIKGRDILLGPVGSGHEKPVPGQPSYKNTGKPLAAPGTPQLLVRVLDLATPAVPEESPSLAVETIEFVKTDDTHQYAGRSTGMGRRLVLPSRSVEPRFRVLLFPHRAGDPLPETRWETPEILSVTAAGKTTRIRFAPETDGSTRLEFPGP